MKTSLLFLLLLQLPLSANAQLNDNSDSISELMDLGDSMVQKQAYSEALLIYDKICALDSTQCPKEKIARLSILQAPICIWGAEYQKLITAADKKFNHQDFLKARQYYERATLIRKNDPYPKEQISRIDALIKIASFLRLTIF